MTIQLMPQQPPIDLRDDFLLLSIEIAFHPSTTYPMNTGNSLPGRIAETDAGRLLNW